MSKTDTKNITIITTHVNADFDGIGSMLAAQKLYPGSIVVHQSANEKNIRNFFISSMAYLFNMADIKDIDFARVRRLVIVDTRRKSRIGDLASLVQQKGIDIHVYDHHPPMPNDIKPNQEFYAPTGATTTILTERLKTEGIHITPDEATVMCLGIYEDTGSFTFPSTTDKDFFAAGFLISKGANLNMISDLISREINPAQVGLLNDMLQSANQYKINGMAIIITCVSTENYVQDFAFLVHKMLKMENVNAIFAAARMGSKIYIVARSSTSDVNVGNILTSIGGGGHTHAAAATIRDKTLVQIEHELIDVLYKKVTPSRLAADLMSSPAITIQPDMSIADAAKTLTRYNVNALVVADEKNHRDRLLGYISRQVIEKALYHNLSEVPVREYMHTEIASVSPDADIFEIQNKIIENKQRIIPVIDKGRINGVITRTDLLKTLVDERRNKAGDIPDPFHQSVQARTRDVRKLMNERLPRELITMLQTIGRVADDIGYNAYVVGGFVRDLFLYRPNEDLDVVIEGNGIEFAKEYAGIANARINAYDKFGTAVIIFPDGFKIDVASARMEHYKFPAALPTVEMSSIKLDLFRRDFTINTLAIQLSGDNFGTLIDFFSAQRDIKEKSIRILHNLSFVEDPTRVFRAIRFEQRFEFTIGKLTSGLIENAVKMDFFKRLSGRRVQTELRQILSEENPTPAIIRLADYDLLKFIHPSLKIDKKIITLLNAVKKVLNWHDLLFLEEPYNKWAVYFLAMIRQCNRKTTQEICMQLELAPRHQNFFCKERFEADRCLFELERRLPKKNSTLYNRLNGFKTELILFMMASTKQKKVEKAISKFVTQLRHTTISIKGRDLVGMGIKPGPLFSRILDATLAAKLNNYLKTRKDEIEFVKKYISSGQTGPAPPPP